MYGANDLSTDAEKGIFQYPFMAKAFNKVDKEGTYLNVIKPIYDKLIANNIFNVEKLK